MRRAGLAKKHQNGSLTANGQLLLNLNTYEALVGTRPVHLTAKEFQLLHIFIGNNGSVLTYSALESALWEEYANGCGRVKKYVQRLRSKLGDNAKSPRWIASIHGIGYRFIGPASTTQETPVNLTIETILTPLADVLI